MTIQSHLGVRHRHSWRLALFLAATICVCLSSSNAGAQSKDKEATYTAKARPAEELAQLVRQVLPVEIKVMPDKLVLRGAADSLVQADQFLRQLDRVPAKLNIEFLIAEIVPTSKDFPIADLTGSIAEVKTSMTALAENKRLSGVLHFEKSVDVLENFDFSEEKTAIIKMNVFKLKNGQTGFSQAKRKYGTTIYATAQPIGDQRIRLKMKLFESRPLDNEDALLLGLDDQGQTIRSSTMVTNALDTQLILSPNRPLTFLGPAIPGTPRLLVVVQAKLSE